jgi:ABC-type phosphate/phosphonate transport system substrate-binding protein
MDMLRSPFHRLRAGLAVLAVLAFPEAVLWAQKSDERTLRIGTSGSLTTAKDSSQEKGAIDSLKDFIRTETNMNNEIVRRKDWRDLAEGMSKGEMQIGVFQGYEFAWAQEKYPSIKPLALAVNIHRYPVTYVVTKHDNPARDFASLQGQSLCLPNTGQRYLHLFVERQAEAAGKTIDTFFSKVTQRDNIEDAVDDVVDGTVQAAVLDRASLEAYKRRKPGRFKQLKEVAHSQPLPPVVIAYQDKALDDATLKRFRDGLLRANQSDRGQTMLTTFKLSGFEATQEDFDKVLAETRKAYPPK